MLRYLVLFAGLCAPALGQVESWISNEDGSLALSAQPAIAWQSTAEASTDDAMRIEIHPATRYQSILGLGASLEHATCYNLSLLPEPRRREVLKSIVDPVDGIGMNLMRICIGTPDFTGDPWYSYCDPPDGQPDPELKHFSIEKDRAYVLPILKMALELNPDLIYFAAPWSAPAWMKTNQSMLGGKVDPQWYGPYAEYLAKFVEAYGAEGLPILSVTPQNEPNFPNPAYPTAFWKGEDQRVFIRDHLGPVFTQRQLNTEIWCWDHNFNKLDFPRTILNDPAAAQYVKGVAFHHYEGQPEAMSELHAEFPNTDLYFTEGSVFRTRGALQIISFLRNWARSYNAWVIVLDENRKPNNGPHSASRTIIEYMSDKNDVVFHPDYYMYGQFMKFIPRGAVRIASTEGDRRVANVAVITPDQHYVLVAANASTSPRELSVFCGGKAFAATLPPRSTATYRWAATEQ